MLKKNPETYTSKCANRKVVPDKLTLEKIFFFEKGKTLTLLQPVAIRVMDTISQQTLPPKQLCISLPA